VAWILFLIGGWCPSDAAEGRAAEFGNATGRLLVGQHNERRDKTDRCNDGGKKHDLAQLKY
jgi:hypothetical protein